MTTCTCDTFSSSASTPAVTITQTGTGIGCVISQISNNVNALNVNSNASSQSAIAASQTGAGYCVVASTHSSSLPGIWSQNYSTGPGIVAEATSGAAGIFQTSSSTGVALSAIGGGNGINASSLYGTGGTFSTSSSSITEYGVSATSSGGPAGLFSATGSGGTNQRHGISASCLDSTSYGVNAVSPFIGVYSTGGQVGLYSYGSEYGAWLQNNSSIPGSVSLYCTGNSTFEGYITKSGGGYRVDHPSDPANKLLNHCFVESPEMKNVYDGVVVLDDQGNAEITMPVYFEAANSDFRYQLTGMGAAMPNLHVASEVSQGKFSVAGGVAGMKVSWQVTGVRADKWALANHPGVEIEKKEKGFYLHPELYGFDRSRSIDKMGRTKL